MRTVLLAVLLCWVKSGFAQRADTAAKPLPLLCLESPLTTYHATYPEYSEGDLPDDPNETAVVSACLESLQGVPRDGLSLFIDTNSAACFRFDTLYQGYAVMVANGTDSVAWLPSVDGRIYLRLQAVAPDGH